MLGDKRPFIGSYERHLSEENATPLALASCSSLSDRVDVARQPCPINNETAMRFVGCAPIFPPHFPRLYMENAVSM